MLLSFNNLKWGLSEKGDGAMNIRSPILDEQCMQNRNDYFSRSGINPADFVSAALVHGTHIAVVTEKDKGRIIPDTDGLITDRRGVYLTVTVGDCVPLYFFDSNKQAIGLAHAGWRGIVKNIARSAVEAMKNEFGSKPKDISVHIGPHLQKCHFEVKEDVAALFGNEFVIAKPDCLAVDLQATIKKQLTAAGIAAENISSSDECTYCQAKKYFSYRRDKPENVESMVAFIGISTK